MSGRILTSMLAALSPEQEFGLVEQLAINGAMIGLRHFENDEAAIAYCEKVEAHGVDATILPVAVPGEEGNLYAVVLRRSALPSMELIDWDRAGQA